MNSRCGMCNELIVASRPQALLDAIRLHCREYHPTFGEHGKVFDKLDATLLNLYMNMRESDDI